MPDAPPTGVPAGHLNRIVAALERQAPRRRLPRVVGSCDLHTQGVAMSRGNGRLRSHGHCAGTRR